MNFFRSEASGWRSHSKWLMFGGAGFVLSGLFGLNADRWSDVGAGAILGVVGFLIFWAADRSLRRNSN
jgi:uncharacterized membrane protein YjjP (DUF1212 family)